jgi:hypothetical protein
MLALLGFSKIFFPDGTIIEGEWFEGILNENTRRQSK